MLLFQIVCLPFFMTVPHEIRARGSAAELAYSYALLEGKVKVCRARLLIIGQDRAGKTSLKKSLIGLPFNPEEPSTEVLEMNSSKLEVNVEQVVEWKAISDDSDVEQVRPQDMSIARLVVENMMQKKENNEGQISPVKEKEMDYVKDVAGPAQVCYSIDLSDFVVSTLVILEEHESPKKFKGAWSQ